MTDDGLQRTLLAAVCKSCGRTVAKYGGDGRQSHQWWRFARVENRAGGKHFASGGMVDPVEGGAIGTIGALITSFFADSKLATPSFTTLHDGAKLFPGTSPGLKPIHATEQQRGHVALEPSRVGGVPTAAGKHQGETHSIQTNDNRIIVSGNTLSDPHQLAAPMQEMSNSRTYSRGGMQSDGRSGSMPAYTGGGGG